MPEEVRKIYSAVPDTNLMCNGILNENDNHGVNRLNVYTIVEKEWATSERDSWRLLHQTGLGEFHRITIDIYPKTKSPSVQCNCDQYQKYRTCFESKKYGYIFLKQFPQDEEKMFEGPKDSNTENKRKTTLGQLISKYKTECGKEIQNSAIYTRLAPVTDPQNCA